MLALRVGHQLGAAPVELAPVEQRGERVAAGHVTLRAQCLHQIGGHGLGQPRAASPVSARPQSYASDEDRRDKERKYHRRRPVHIRYHHGCHTQKQVRMHVQKN
ncbi:hypothetical protein Prum_078280 [Phytohabitans rumicis]|uniref:Uncharacterized protein n=1 Tax=Phytohabitans rumicis TaxID=1076125 RepID=A0A6V8LJ38_9ACTN|nr:hypothetical protein Prum_078280 [Phytohabitans rumicis]